AELAEMIDRIIDAGPARLTPAPPNRIYLDTIADTGICPPRLPDIVDTTGPALDAWWDRPAAIKQLTALPENLQGGDTHALLARLQFADDDLAQAASSWDLALSRGWTEFDSAFIQALPQLTLRPQALQALARLEVHRRRQPAVEHALITQVQSQATATEMGAKSWRAVLSNRLGISGTDAGRRIEEAAALGERRAVTGEP
ncbi:MAG: DUF222 domain-containing protein, partial [Burkholderiaceae bacterium]|nr:DUF222 domain-containing protein [Burkholderiaceae bacterium]